MRQASNYQINSLLLCVLIDFSVKDGLSICFLVLCVIFYTRVVGACGKNETEKTKNINILVSIWRKN
jgi:hypothetical protein